VWVVEWSRLSGQRDWSSDGTRVLEAQDCTISCLGGGDAYEDSDDEMTLVDENM
jgi:hypothetical protein